MRCSCLPFLHIFGLINLCYTDETTATSVDLHLLVAWIVSSIVVHNIWKGQLAFMCQGVFWGSWKCAQFPQTPW